MHTQVLSLNSQGLNFQFAFEDLRGLFLVILAINI